MKCLRHLASVAVLVMPLALYAQQEGVAGATAVAATSTQHLQQHTGSQAANVPARTSSANDAIGSCASYAYTQAYGDCKASADETSLSEVGAGGGAGGH